MDSEPEPKDVIVLGAIKQGIKKFEKIQKTTQVDPEELNGILEQLEKRGLIKVEEKKGWLGKKIEIHITEKGSKEVEERVHELETKWNQMSALYKTGDKSKLKQLHLLVLTPYLKSSITVKIFLVFNLSKIIFKKIFFSLWNKIIIPMTNFVKS